MAAKFPKWAQNVVTVQRTVYVGSVAQMLEDLGVLPPDAIAYVLTDSMECYGHDELMVEWQRNMSADEYEVEKAVRAKRRKVKAAEKEKLREIRYQTMVRSAEAFGVDIVVREEVDDE